MSHLRLATPTLPLPTTVGAARRALRELVDRRALGRIGARIAGQLRPSIRLSLAAAELEPRASRLGGRPDLPEGFAWPCGPKGPLSFIGQLRLEELAELGPDGALPRRGLLSFFYDAANGPTGLGHGEPTSWRVLHMTAPRARLVATPPPRTLRRRGCVDVRFLPRALVPSLEITLPFWRSREVRAWNLSAEELASYQGLYGDDVPRAWRKPGNLHRALGHADAVQGDMPRMLSYWLADRWAELDGEPVPSLERGADEWILLLQISTEEATSMSWGEGRLYFWIRRADLQKRRFDAVQMVFQA